MAFSFRWKKWHTRGCTHGRGDQILTEYHITHVHSSPTIPGGGGEGDEDPEEMHLQYVKEKQIKCEWAAKQGRKIDNQIKPSKCRCCHRNFPSRSNFWAHWNQVCQGKLLLLLRRAERTGTCYRIELILNVRNSIKSSFPGFSAAPRD